MVCPKCRKNLSGSPSFCGYCGTKLAKAPTPRVSQTRDVPKREAQPITVHENPASENVAKCPMCGSTSLQAMKKGVSVKIDTGGKNENLCKMQ